MPEAAPSFSVDLVGDFQPDGFCADSLQTVAKLYFVTQFARNWLCLWLSLQKSRKSVIIFAVHINSKLVHVSSNEPWFQAESNGVGHALGFFQVPARHTAAAAQSQGQGHLFISGGLVHSQQSYTARWSTWMLQGCLRPSHGSRHSHQKFGWRPNIMGR